MKLSLAGRQHQQQPRLLLRREQLQSKQTCGTSPLLTNPNPNPGGDELPDLTLTLTLQNTSLSSLDESVDQFDGSKSQSSQNQPLQRAHRGQRSPSVVSSLLNSKVEERANTRPCPVLAVSSVSGSAFRSFHVQQSSTSSSEELPGPGKKRFPQAAAEGSQQLPSRCLCLLLQGQLDPGFGA